MYGYAFRLLRLYWRPILAASALLFALELKVASPPYLNMIPNIVAFGYLAFYFYVSLLTGNAVEMWKKSETKVPMRIQYWLAYLFPVVTAFAILGAFGLLVGHLLPRESAVISALFLSFTTLPILVCLLGTMIPAAVLGLPIGLSVTLNRARSTFWFIMVRLVAGPGVCLIGLALLAMQLNHYGLIKNVPGNASDPLVCDVAWGVGTNIFDFFVGALVASILSMAYLRSEENRNPVLPPKSTLPVSKEKKGR